MKQRLLKVSLKAVGVGLTSSAILYPTSTLVALPPPEDSPEEVLRTEIITQARSPLDGKPISAAEYAELQAQLRTGPEIQPELSPKLKRTIALLRLRRLVRSVFPFLLR